MGGNSAVVLHAAGSTDCRVHGVTNLFIAGSSVFPTTGHANPPLTIVALAVRLADTLRTFA
ncbi:GMC oxidoreductase [Nocardia vinacea]|uniref:GMC oxidoreductase n=1 Tax=Nocardia vinacea TaxID=96468 RepID=UPI003AF1FBB6